jgi:uncharacterized protein YdeI (YjbR/CyaY-like superfamily)
MPEITERFFARNRTEWRSWLESHHADKAEIWLILLKRHVDEPCVSYPESVEEALCFGWIDGILKRIDDRQHAVRFSPRRKGSIWSSSNLTRVEHLMREGRMQSAGLRAYQERDPGKCLSPGLPPGQTLELPDYFEAALKSDPRVWSRFGSLSTSHKKRYLDWIAIAKREETRIRRARKAVEMIREEMEG